MVHHEIEGGLRRVLEEHWRLLGALLDAPMQHEVNLATRLLRWAVFLDRRVMGRDRALLLVLLTFALGAIAVPGRFERRLVLVHDSASPGRQLLTTCLLMKKTWPGVAIYRVVEARQR